MAIQVIHLHYPFDNLAQPQPKQVIAMGFFDGVHRGHQTVIRRAAAMARSAGLSLGVLTYSPYPTAVFQKVSLPLRYITPEPQKVALLKGLGVERVYILQLTSQLAALPPQEFVNQVLLKLNPATVVAGFDHLYGAPDLEADMAHLPAYSQGNFTVEEVAPVIAAGKISSSRIRQHLAEGDVDAVAADLGRYHETTGLVVHGDARGRTLGFPTVNLATPSDERLPAIGVYVVQICIQNRWYQGMASIGRNVTFEADRPVTVEVNVFDFDRAVYGELVAVRWCHYLRGEAEFSGASALIEQLQADQVASRQYFQSI